MVHAGAMVERWSATFSLGGERTLFLSEGMALFEMNKLQWFIKALEVLLMVHLEKGHYP